MTDDAPELSPEFENIPEPLRGRPQWLMWDARADRPKQPHWNGDHYGISWSDPDDWGSWSDARELVAGTDSWGIGYVNAVENDDYPSGRVFSLDIDGGVVDAEAAELAEWVPPLEPFLERDAYVEISPSGEGLKIPVLASSAPEWWSDMDNDDEHVGCEVLANKFTTLTGNLWPGAGTELPVYGDWLDEWLEAAAAGLAETREVYEKQTRPTPQSSLDETARGDADGAADYEGDGYDADVETVRDALACVSPDLGYNEWRNVGFAVCDAVDAGDGVENRTTARELYVAWSRGDYHPDLADDATASSWDSDARSRAEAVIDGWEPPSDGDVTAGTLWSLALDADHGPKEWSPPSDWGGGERDESVKETVARYSDEFDDPSEVPDDVVPSAADTASDTEASREIGAEAAAVAGSPPDGDSDGETADPRAGGGGDGGGGDGGGDDDSDGETGWATVRSLYAAADYGDVQKGYARETARTVLERQYTFLGIDERDEPLVYNPETGVFDDSLAEIKGTLRDELGEYWSSYEVNEILRGCRAANIVTRDRLDAAHHSEPLVCVKNGVLNLDTGELESDHSPQYRFVSRVPVQYDPDADAAEVRQFVDSLVGRDADRQALLEMVGHALHPEAHTRFQKFLILTGPTNNGKSQFFSLVRSLLNGDTVESDREEVANNTASVKLQKVAQNRFSMNSIHGNLANIAGEIDGKKIRNTASLKDITGGDAVEIEPKGTASFFDRIHATQMFAANDPPIIGERDKAAVASRIVPVELPYTFAFADSGRYDPDDPTVKEAEPARSLRERLHTEENLSALLNLALDGLERLRENGGDVSLPESPEERLKRYERRADPMRRFGEVCLEDDPDDYVVKQDVTEIYREWARAEGFEVGSSVHSVLHDALRGASGFTYTDARKRAPTYDDTDLALRGYDDRLFALTQTTLTEEGLAYARRAGLVDDGDDEAGGRRGPLTPSEVTLDAATDRGRFPTVEGTVSATYRDNYGNPKASLEGDDGAVVEVEIEGPEPAALEAENVVRLTRAKVVRDGYVKLVCDPTTEVVAVSTPGGDGDDQAATATATDGGADTDSDGGEPESGATAESGDDDRQEDDPERPHGPHDDAQCREYGARPCRGVASGARPRPGDGDASDGRPRRRR